MVLCFDRTARLQVEQPIDMSGHGFRNVDPPGYSERFHEPCGVDRVASDIEAHPAVADDAGNDRSGMDADAQLQVVIPGCLALRRVCDAGRRPRSHVRRPGRAGKAERRSAGYPDHCDDCRAARRRHPSVDGLNRFGGIDR